MFDVKNSVIILKIPKKIKIAPTVDNMFRTFFIISI